MGDCTCTLKEVIGKPSASYKDYVYECYDAQHRHIETVRARSPVEAEAEAIRKCEARHGGG